MAREDEIKLIAYSIWESEGCCDGHDGDHWLRAEAIWEVNNNKARSASKAAPKQAARQDGRNKATGDKHKKLSRIR
jgi:hypothetical protein